MAGPKKHSIGLVIRSGPFAGRSARDQLDLALTAATLDYEVDLFFTGEGVLQLLAEHDPHGAGLPRGSRGWKSLPGLSRVRAYVSRREWQSLRDAGRELLLDATPMTREEMAPLLAKCRQALVV